MTSLNQLQLITTTSSNSTVQGTHLKGKGEMKVQSMGREVGSDTLKWQRQGSDRSRFKRRESPVRDAVDPLLHSLSVLVTPLVVAPSCSAK